LAEQTRIGSVASVSGSRLQGVLVQSPDPAEQRRLDEAAQVGAMVKIRTSRGLAFGLVSSLSIDASNGSERRLLDVDLLGEASQDPEQNLRFERGVSAFPGLAADIWAADSRDLAAVYARPKASNVLAGRLHQDPDLPAYLVTDELLGKHFAVLGTTGSGKSCAAAVILRAVLENHPCGHVLLLDPHDEYAAAFGEMAEQVGPQDLELPYWLLTLEEAAEVLCSRRESLREQETPILKQAILTAKREWLASSGKEAALTVDAPVPYRLARILELLDQGMGRLDKPGDSLPYMRLKSRIEELLSDKRFSFMFQAVVVQDVMTRILSRLLRIPVEGRPLTIFSLAGLPSEIVDVVVSLVCRMLFDYALWSDPGRRAPTLLVCEEAHRYVPRDPGLGFAPTRRAVSRIAKEGRKYGVSLGLITQRPSEVSETILSQCSTLFALRMANHPDQSFVRHALPDNLSGLLSALPVLRTGEAVVVGEGVTLPMRIRFSDLTETQRPRSDTAGFSEAWRAEGTGASDLARTVQNWRGRKRNRDSDPAGKP
jgi:hypothetical protein